jgi:nucleotide-binding universal stress UspA family protein
MFTNILVAIDGSPTAERGLRTALGLAADQHATLHVVHVIDDLAAMPAFDSAYVPATYIDTMIDSLREGGERVLARARKLATGAGVNAQMRVVESLGRSVAQTILREARKVHADLIVMGTHGRRGLNRALLGSDAENVLREATCPVLLVRDTRAPRASKPAGGKPAGGKPAGGKAAGGKAARPASPGAKRTKRGSRARAVDAVHAARDLS